jgi:hypothetical protein
LATLHAIPLFEYPAKEYAMGGFRPIGLHWGRRTIGMVLLTTAVLLTGCVKPYLDPGTVEVPRSEFKQTEQPKAAHLVFEFQTKGAPNARATKFLLDQVTQEIKGSGLFASVDAAGSPDVAMLQVTLNNIPVDGENDAFAKGFGTGLTFGLIGSSVSDGYICTVSYLAPGSGTPIVKTAHHAIHTTVGNHSAPPGAIPVADSAEAVRAMTRQILSHALDDLSKDPQF